MRVLNTERKLWKYFIFGGLTCLIYDIYMFWTMIDDLNEVFDDTDEKRVPHFLLVALLIMVTCGIYFFIWWYQMGNRMRDAGDAYGLKIREDGTHYLLFTLLGSVTIVLPWIAMYQLFENSNKLCEAYNKRRAAAEPEASKEEPKEIPSRNNVALPKREDASQSLTTFRVSGVMKFVSGQYKDAEIKLEDGYTYLLGRNPAECQFVFQDTDISRKHCSVRCVRNEGYFYVTDYSSLGTMMNDTIRLEKGKETICPPGTKITMGERKNSFILK